MIVGGALWGGFNWGHSDIDVNVNRYNSFNRTNITNVNNINNVNRTNQNETSPTPGSTTRRIAKAWAIATTATQQKYGRGSSPESLAGTREFSRPRSRQRQCKSRDLSAGTNGNEFRDLGGGGESRDLGNRANENRDLGGGAEEPGSGQLILRDFDRNPGEAAPPDPQRPSTVSITQPAPSPQQPWLGESGGMSRGGGRRR